MMRCTSCKSCTVACPFGVIIPEFIPYLSSKCDYCIGTSEKEAPKCISSCNHNAVDFKEVIEEPENFIFFVGGNLAVKSRKWFREEQTPSKKK
jgi:Fe-S-cluster-containing dehydrogenase component